MYGGRYRIKFNILTLCELRLPAFLISLSCATNFGFGYMVYSRNQVVRLTITGTHKIYNAHQADSSGEPE
jgi:hypothetical protein